MPTGRRPGRWVRGGPVSGLPGSRARAPATVRPRSAIRPRHAGCRGRPPRAPSRWRRRTSGRGPRAVSIGGQRRASPHRTPGSPGPGRAAALQASGPGDPGPCRPSSDAAPPDWTRSDRHGCLRSSGTVPRRTAYPGREHSATATPSHLTSPDAPRPDVDQGAHVPPARPMWERPVAFNPAGPRCRGARLVARLPLADAASPAPPPLSQGADVRFSASSTP